uniref:Uncharacterized protein n=1 Tax=Russula abietina TaxID=482377 RepID=A0A2S0U3R0_9AGAM|nr:hypothetical protein [Russula abietina]AWB36126.1 hypothetical protein [Russula abietina]
MNINLILETLLLLFSILVGNGVIYSFTIFNLKKENSSENLSVITNRNSSEKDVLALTLLIGSSPLRLTSSESSSSQTLISSESSSSTLVNSSSSETNVSEEIFDNLVELDMYEEIMTQTQHSVWSHRSVTRPSDEVLSHISERTRPSDEVLSHISEGTRPSDEVLSHISEGTLPSNLDVINHATSYTSLDSRTILNSETVELWRESVRILHDFPINTPAGILQEFKLDEINILYSQDIIHFGISQTELRLIIELIPSWSLFDPTINHFILTIMSYYHL